MKNKVKAAAPSLGQPAEQSRQAHVHTDAAATGLGHAAASAPGRLAKGPLSDMCVVHPAAKWSPRAVPPSAIISCSAAAVELELARAAALDQLRHKLNSLCAKAGLRNVPLLAFERWRFAAKWAEDEPRLAAAALNYQDNSSSLQSQEAAAALVVQHDSSKQSNQTPAAAAGGSSSSSRKPSKPSKPSDPVIPFASLPQAPEPGLVADLVRSGLDHDQATKIAMQLAAAAAEAAAAVLKRRHQLASGKAVSCPDLVVSFHKHSLDMKCGGRFVKVSRTAYGKLARLYRTHTLSQSNEKTAAAAAAGADCTIGLPLEAAAAKLASLQANLGTTAAGVHDHMRSGSDSSSSSSDDDDDVDKDHDDLNHESQGAPPAAAAAGAAVSKHHTTLLCAEARIAELEQQQQQSGRLSDASSDAASAGNSGSSARLTFHQRLFALLLRYKSIQGHGFQAAAGPPVFKLLRDRLSVGFECFASPLNAHFNRYGSAFPDVDGPFGSAGSFFRLHLTHGSYEANPPFVPSILTATAVYILQQLESCELSGGVLSFVMVMPGWQEVEGWLIVNESRFLRRTILVAAADHGYCDGASHQRKDIYRQSPFDSALLFLQTSAAAKKWPVTDALVTDLTAAFADCCPTAAAADRQRKQRGLRDLERQGLVSVGRSDQSGDHEEQERKRHAQQGLDLQDKKKKKQKQQQELKCGQQGMKKMKKKHHRKQHTTN